MTNHAPVADAPVLFEIRGRVAVITLNRPKALNSINSALASQLGAAVERLQDDPELRVGIITGTGRAFCAGMDLKAFAVGESADAVGHPEWGFAGFVRHRISKPLIAAVNGFALGGGSELALACDLIVADETAHFGLPEVTRGLFPAAGGLIRIAQQVPEKVALELVLTGRPLAADEALRWGLVNRVSPVGQSLAEATDLASKIAENAPLAVQASKRVLYRTHQMSSLDSQPWDISDAEMSALFSTADAREGATAFAEKRAPVWTAK